MLTREELTLVQNEWRHIMTRDEEFAEKFYQALFQLDPELEKLFKRSLKMQGRKVVSMFDSAITSLDQPAKMMRPLVLAGRRHIQYGVKTKDYAVMKEAFIAAIKRVRGDEMPDANIKAWRRAFDAMADTMSVDGAV